MCAERVDWQNELRATWEERSRKVADWVYENADLTSLGQVEDHSGWSSEVGGAGDGRSLLQMSRPVFFEAEEPEEDSYTGHVSAVFHLPGSNGQCPVLPTSSWASAGNGLVDLAQDAEKLAAVEKPLWSLYEALLRHSDGTLLDLGLNALFEKTQDAFEKFVGANHDDLFLEAYQMLADMKALALVDYDLHNAFLEVKAATDHLEHEPAAAPAM